jgi:DNA-binding response OmpR family regulator
MLLDVMMPRMSGLDVLKALKANPETASIPVIMVTAKTTDDDVLHGYQQGADYYITKPFTADQLLYGINLVLGNQSSEMLARAPS